MFSIVYFYVLLFHAAEKVEPSTFVLLSRYDSPSSSLFEDSYAVYNSESRLGLVKDQRQRAYILHDR